MMHEVLNFFRYYHRARFQIWYGNRANASLSTRQKVERYFLRRCPLTRRAICASERELRLFLSKDRILNEHLRQDPSSPLQCFARPTPRNLLKLFGKLAFQQLISDESEEGFVRSDILEVYFEGLSEERRLLLARYLRSFGLTAPR